MKRPSFDELIFWYLAEIRTLLDTRYTRTRRVMVVYLSSAVACLAIGAVLNLFDMELPRLLLLLLSLVLTSICLGAVIYILLLERTLGAARNSAHQPPSLLGISDFADFWGLSLRKRIKATAGDFDVEVKRLHKEKRYRMAKWNVVLAWGYAIWYVLRGPYDLVKGALVKAMQGL